MKECTYLPDYRQRKDCPDERNLTEESENDREEITTIACSTVSNAFDGDG